MESNGATVLCVVLKHKVNAPAYWQDTHAEICIYANVNYLSSFNLLMLAHCAVFFKKNGRFSAPVMFVEQWKQFLLSLGPLRVEMKFYGKKTERESHFLVKKKKKMHPQPGNTCTITVSRCSCVSQVFVFCTSCFILIGCVWVITWTLFNVSHLCLIVSPFLLCIYAYVHFPPYSLPHDFYTLLGSRWLQTPNRWFVARH